MTNNDILRRLRYSFEFNDNKMIALFALADMNVTQQQVTGWLKKEEDTDFIKLEDSELATFLNGLINDKRGKKDGPQHPPEKRLNNNIILTKLKIALNLKAEDIIAMLAKVDFNISKPELSALFRKPDHKHFRECKAQILRNFLMAIQGKYRVSKPPKAKQNTEQQSTGNAPRKNKTARPNASKMYVNPKATQPTETKPKSDRKVLKLKPEDIWKDHK